MSIKIQGGTPQHSESAMCLTCRRAHVMKGQSLSDERIICRTYGDMLEIKTKITSCSQYDDARQPSYHELEQIAWTVTTSPSRKLGFMSPQERRNRDMP